MRVRGVESPLMAVREIVDRSSGSLRILDWLLSLFRCSCTMAGSLVLRHLAQHFLGRFF